MPTQENTYGLLIRPSGPSETSTSSWRACQATSEQAGRPSVVRLPDGTTARHIRIQRAHQANPLSLAEVRVRGVPPT